MTLQDLSWLSWWGDADWVVRGVFASLVALSLATWWVIGYKLWHIGRAAGHERTMARRLAHEDGALPGPAGRGTTGRLIAEAGRGRPDRHALEQRFSQVLRQARLDLESGMTLLATIGNSAPFIGLLGTVWGIMHALQGLDADAAVSLEMVAGPVAEALVATAAGLFAAIPAVIGYNLLLRLVRRVAATSEANALAIIERATDERVLRPLIRPAVGE